MVIRTCLLLADLDSYLGSYQSTCCPLGDQGIHLNSFCLIGGVKVRPWDLHIGCDCHLIAPTYISYSGNYFSDGGPDHLQAYANSFTGSASRICCSFLARWV